MSSNRPPFVYTLSPRSFADIRWGEHTMKGAVQAIVIFPNQYGLSIIAGGEPLVPAEPAFGSGLYGDGISTWEVGPIYVKDADNPDSWELCGDVVGWCPREMVEGMMAGAASRPPKPALLVD